MMPRWFWRRVDIRAPDECWPWLGMRTVGGYGRFKRGGDSIRAHRFAFECVTGEQAGASFICHRCDNPPCCNPAHLWRGTPLTNNRDKIEKGRARYGLHAGTHNPNHVLKVDEVMLIKRFLREGATNTFLGDLFGVTHSQISNIRRGVSWSPRSIRVSNPCFGLERAAS